MFIMVENKCFQKYKEKSCLHFTVTIKCKIRQKTLFWCKSSINQLDRYSVYKYSLHFTVMASLQQIR